ncbi:MAG: hypothetical protein ACREXX_16785 [Gammaproteobacteria bacterium]
MTGARIDVRLRRRRALDLVPRRPRPKPGVLLAGEGLAGALRP